MKKIILMVAAAMALVVPATAQKVNDAAILAKLNKSDVEAADA